MTVSLLCAQQIDDMDVLQEYAELCGPDGFDRLWLGQSLMIESFAALSALAGRGVRVRSGTAVSVAPLRTPYDAALQARSAAALMGEPLSVAFGIGTPQFATMLRGAKLEQPGSYTAEYMTTVRNALSTDDPGSTGSTGGRLYPFRTPRVEVGCGVLRPRMARLAGGAAEFIVTWLAPLPYVIDCLAVEAAAGAAARGRPGPRVVSIVQLAVAHPERHPYKLAYYSCGAHIQAAHYVASLRAAGMALTGDVAHDVQEVVHSGLYVYGSVDSICDTLEEYHHSGVDEVVLNLNGVALMHGGQAALTDARQVAEAWGERQRKRLKRDVLRQRSENV